MKMKIALALPIVVCAAIVWFLMQTQKQLSAENELLRRQITQLNDQTNQISAEDKFQLREWHMINAMKELCVAMRLFAEDHNRRYATNFNEISIEFGPSDKINFDWFEFVNINRVDASTTNAIIFRERLPRVAPNGWWYRIYGLANGEVQSVFGDEHGDAKKFIEYEHQHSPPNQ